MKYNIAKIPIQPFSRFHFGKMKMDHDLALSDTSYFAHSDTLFSALINSASRIEDKGQLLVDSFGTAGLKISSLFYFIESKTDTVYLLPKPAFLNSKVVKSKDRRHKKLAGVKFVSKKVWDKGLEVTKWLDESKYKLVQKNIIVTKEEFEALKLNKESKIFQIDSVPKSPKHNGPKASIYYQSDIVFNDVKGCTVGLYFLYDCPKSLRINFANALHLAALSGFGGEINIQGRTIPAIESTLLSDEAMEFKDHNQYYANISLFNPKSEADLEAIVFHETLLRGGRFYDHLDGRSHAQVVRMIAEGALFKHDKIEGRLVSIGTDMNGNTIMRNGIPLLIPINYER